MRKPTRRTETGRGERVLPGVWRLRLPLPWPPVPHCNAWALAHGDGIVLVDCGLQTPGSLRDLERALEPAGFVLEDVRLLVCTHAHGDHCGQAAAVRQRSGCELWIHPCREHFTAENGSLDAARELVAGVRVESDVGAWDVYETPGHAPSHVVLHQPALRLLLSGDHVLGRTSLYFDHGWTPDPVAEFLASLELVERLDVRLTLSGHGRPFTDLRGHVAACRERVRERLEAVEGALRKGAVTAPQLVPEVYGGLAAPDMQPWLLTKLHCYLDHLERQGLARRVGGEPERWTAAA